MDKIPVDNFSIKKNAEDRKNEKKKVLSHFLQTQASILCS